MALDFTKVGQIDPEDIPGGAQAIGMTSLLLAPLGLLGGFAGGGLGLPKGVAALGRALSRLAARRNAAAGKVIGPVTDLAAYRAAREAANPWYGRMGKRMAGMGESDRLAWGGAIPGGLLGLMAPLHAGDTLIRSMYPDVAEEIEEARGI